MAMYAKGEFAGFQYNGIKNAWNVKRYSFTNITYPVPSDFVGKTLIAPHIIMDSDTSISLNLGDNYSAIATAYIEFDEDTAITCNVTTDDGGTVTLNDVLIKNQCVSCQATSVTFDFKKGWNKVEICYREGSGNDGFTTATKFSTVAKNMYSEEPTPITLTHTELGKAYDWDGTTSHQLGKGYDWDGTTNNLIYSATPEYLYNAGDEVTDFTGGWAISNNVMTHTASWNGANNGRAVKGSNYIEVGMNSTATSGQYNGSGFVTNNLIDFSDINKLTFNLSINYGVEQYDYWAIALVNNLGGTINKSWILDCRNYGATFGLDTTNFNGSYKLYVGVYTSDGRWGQKRITSIKVN